MTSLVTGRTPTIAIQLAFGQGRRSPSLGRGLIVISNNAAAATGADDTLTQLYDEDEALDFFGAGYCGHLMCKDIWEVDSKAIVYGLVAADSTGTAADRDVVLAGPATAAGTAHVRVGDCILDVPVAVADTEDVFGAAIVAAYAESTTCPSVITYDALSNTLTFTTKSLGTQATQIRIRMYDIPAGLTVDGAASVNTTHNTTPGTNSPNWSSALAAMYAAFPPDVEFILPATNITADLTAATTGLKDRLLAASQPDVKDWANAVIGQCPAAVATATTQADSFDDGGMDPTSESSYWFSIFCCKGNWGLPWEVAARYAAARAADTRTDRNKRWCGLNQGRKLPGLTVPITDAEYMTRADIDACLVNGVTPAYYDKASGTGGVRWPVTCKHSTGGAFDYRASDTNIPDVLMYVGKLVSIRFGDKDWEKLAEDDADGNPPDDLPARTVTPSIATSAYNALYCGTELYGQGYVDKTYVDDGGDTRNATDLTSFEVDAVTAGILNGYVPVFVTRWLRGIGIKISEYGRG